MFCPLNLPSPPSSQWPRLSWPWPNRSLGLPGRASTWNHGWALIDEEFPLADLEKGCLWRVHQFAERIGRMAWQPDKHHRFAGCILQADPVATLDLGGHQLAFSVVFIPDCEWNWVQPCRFRTPAGQLEGTVTEYANWLFGKAKLLTFAHLAV